MPPAGAEAAPRPACARHVVGQIVATDARLLRRVEVLHDGAARAPHHPRAEAVRARRPRSAGRRRAPGEPRQLAPSHEIEPLPEAHPVRATEIVVARQAHPKLRAAPLGTDTSRRVMDSQHPPPLGVLHHREPPGGATPCVSTLQSDTLQSDTLRRNTLPRDTLRRNTTRRDSVPGDTVPDDSV